MRAFIKAKGDGLIITFYFLSFFILSSLFKSLKFLNMNTILNNAKNNEGYFNSS